MVLINTESCRYWTWSKESQLQWLNNISRQVGRCSCIVGSKTIQCDLPNSYCNCLREGKKHANKRKLVTTLQTTHAHSFQLSYKGRKHSPSTTFGLDDDEHQFKILDQYGFEYECRVTETGKVYCPCRRQVEFRLPCRHLCVCISALQRMAILNSTVLDSLWAAPFWHVTTFVEAHKHPSRTHAVNLMQLQKKQLLPPVSDTTKASKKNKKKGLRQRGKRVRNFFNNPPKRKEYVHCVGQKVLTLTYLLLSYIQAQSFPNTLTISI